MCNRRFIKWQTYLDLNLVLNNILFMKSKLYYIGSLSISVFSSASKESACIAGDLGSIPGLGRSPGEGNSYPLQYSGLKNFIDCIVHGVAKSWTRLSDFHFHPFRISPFEIRNSPFCLKFLPLVKQQGFLRHFMNVLWKNKKYFCVCIIELPLNSICSSKLKLILKLRIHASDNLSVHQR